MLSATGTWSQPYIPYIPGMENFRGTQLHTVNYRAAEDFRNKHTIVVGGGLSAVQFLLELEQVTTTTWATRRAPNFSYRPFDLEWGHHVEETVRRRTFRGQVRRRHGADRFAPVKHLGQGTAIHDRQQGSPRGSH